MPAVLTASTSPDVVVLALVVLATLEPGLAPAGAGDGDAELEQPPQGGPLAELGPEDVGAGVRRSRREQRGERPGVRRGVVVEQPDPLGVGPGLPDLLEPEPDGLGVGGGAAGADDTTEGVLEQVGALVLAAGVDRDHAGHRRLLATDPVDDGRQPARPVMADEEGDDGG